MRYTHCNDGHETYPHPSVSICSGFEVFLSPNTVKWLTSESLNCNLLCYLCTIIHDCENRAIMSMGGFKYSGVHDLPKSLKLKIIHYMCKTTTWLKHFSSLATVTSNYQWAIFILLRYPQSCYHYNPAGTVGVVHRWRFKLQHKKVLNSVFFSRVKWLNIQLN